MFGSTGEVLIKYMSHRQAVFVTEGNKMKPLSRGVLEIVDRDPCLCPCPRAPRSPPGGR